MVATSSNVWVVQAVVTGGLGFIGSHLVSQLLELGHEVRVLDNFSTGHILNLGFHVNDPQLTIVHVDLTDSVSTAQAVGNAEIVYHLAANADVRDGWKHPRKDLEQNVLTTHNVLEAMRLNAIPHLVFSSTGSVYGTSVVVPTPEDAPFPIQTSLYGASKVAAEGLIQAYVEGGAITATIFRFVSILGPRYSHGHVLDFVRQLLTHPTWLDVLGDGNQTKSYLHVADCIDALVGDMSRQRRLSIFNLGTNSTCTVRDSIDWITTELDVSPELRFTGGTQGWIGDNPLIHLDTTAMRATGWQPQHSIRDSIVETARWIVANPWILKQR